MKKNFLFQLLLAAFLLPAFSCSDDDSAPEINNATTLNMLDVENGATRLGNSDIYINAANNFQTNECLIAEIGPSKGIGKSFRPKSQRIGLSSSRNAGTPLPSFQGRSREAISIGKIRIGAGRRLLPILCRIRDHERGEKSRRCHPVCLINPEADGLPTYDSTIGTVVSGYEDEIVREFPKDTEFSYDSDLEDLFQITTEAAY